MAKELQKRILSSMIIIPLSLFFIIKGSTFFILFLLILFLISSSEWLNMTKKLEFKLLGISFLIFSFYSTFYIREDGLMSFLLIMIICVSTDLGGYIFGKIFKGPKLTKISPNKTFSGALGSLLFSSSFLLWANYSLTNNIEIYLIVTGCIISVSCQLGDLFFSYLKRKSFLKDTGNFLPGHGGVLDRIDGILLGLPIGVLTLMVLY